MDRQEFDIAPFIFGEMHDEQAWEAERRRGPTPPLAARAAPGRPRPKPRPPARRPWPALGRVDEPSAPCVCPAHGTEFVRWVQNALNQFEGAALTVDGVMRAATRSALRNFQRRQGLPVDGIAGPETEQALREARRSGQPPAGLGDAAEPAPDAGEVYEFETLDFESPASLPTLRQGSRGSPVTDLQRRLSAAGFSPGPADGIFGSQTGAAVRAFQSARGLSVDGIVGPQTWASLDTAAPGKPSARPSSGGWGGLGSVRYGKGWGGSEGVADAAKAIAASMSVPVTSQKRDLADTIRVGSTTASDHYTGNTTAFATDFGVSGPRGDELAGAIATKYGIPHDAIGTFDDNIIQVGDRRYRLQLLWRVAGHFDHVHLGIRRA